MNSLNERILAVLQARRDEYVRFVEIIVADEQRLNTEVYGPAEVTQLVGGVLSLLTEALVGEGTEVRSFFLQTSIQGMVGRGGELSGLIASAIRLSILLVSDVSRHVADDDREAATQWLAKFYGDYMAELVLLVTKPPAP
jgi:hypothetical protein